jgi:hypothetical protein
MQTIKTEITHAATFANEEPSRANFGDKLSGYACHQALIEHGRARGTQFKCSMLRVAATLSDLEKAAIDSMVVGTISAEYHVDPTWRERKADPAWHCGFVFEKDTPEAKALQRARALMMPSTAAEAKEAIKKLVQFSAKAKAAKAANKVADDADKLAAFKLHMENFLKARSFTAAECSAALPLIGKTLTAYAKSL